MGRKGDVLEYGCYPVERGLYKVAALTECVRRTAPLEVITGS